MASDGEYEIGSGRSYVHLHVCYSEDFNINRAMIDVAKARRLADCVERISLNLT